MMAGQRRDKIRQVMDLQKEVRKLESQAEILQTLLSSPEAQRSSPTKFSSSRRLLDAASRELPQGRIDLSSAKPPAGAAASDDEGVQDRFQEFLGWNIKRLFQSLANLNPQAAQRMDLGGLSSSPQMQQLLVGMMQGMMSREILKAAQTQLASPVQPIQGAPKATQIVKDKDFSVPGSGARNTLLPLGLDTQIAQAVKTGIGQVINTISGRTSKPATTTPPVVGSPTSNLPPTQVYVPPIPQAPTTLYPPPIPPGPTPPVGSSMPTPYPVLPPDLPYPLTPPPIPPRPPRPPRPVPPPIPTVTSPLTTNINPLVEAFGQAFRSGGGGGIAGMLQNFAAMTHRVSHSDAFTGLFTGLGKMLPGRFGAPFRKALKRVPLSLGNIGKGVSVVTEFAGALAKATVGTLKWADDLHKANMEFAQYSAAMAGVQARQEVREIQLSRERGGRRAESAEFLAESMMDLKKTWSVIEDGLAIITNYVVGGLAETLDVIINILTLGLLKKDKTEENETITDLLRRLTDKNTRDWLTKHGQPNRFRRD